MIASISFSTYYRTGHLNIRLFVPRGSEDFFFALVAYVWF